MLAGAALYLHSWRGEALFQNEVVGVDGAQGVQAVAGEGQESTGLVRPALIRLEDGRVRTGPLQRHRGHRSGDATTGDQGLLPAVHAPSFPATKRRQSLSVRAQIRNVAGPRPI